MPSVLISGGTGTIGKRLTQLLLQKGYQVSILSRSADHYSGNDIPENGLLKFYQWDVVNQTIDPEAVSTADYIIHLAGAGVADKRWSRKRKQEILDSRTQSSALLVKALRENPHQVKSVVSASAIGWYGPDRNNSTLTGFVESDPCYPDYLGDTCMQWEASILPVTSIGKRLVILRTGIVLSNAGGAFVEFKKPLAFKLATVLGSGQQIISWIHEDDLCNQYIYAIEQEHMNGIYNAVAPEPVSNSVLIHALAKKLCGRLYMAVRVPAFILKLMLGEMSIEVLKSTKVNCQKMQDTGFKYQYPTIRQAIDALSK